MTYKKTRRIDTNPTKHFRDKTYPQNKLSHEQECKNTDNRNKDPCDKMKIHKNSKEEQQNRKQELHLP
jgi:hypothetical protein